MSVKATWSVTVSNIGTVYIGPSEQEALAHYREYVSQSVSAVGRAANESVVLWRDNEPTTEYFPPTEEKE